MSIEKIVYQAHATATGGREGRTVSSDGSIDLKLTTPKQLGGSGLPGANPEQLFAAGYAACFIGAMRHVAGQRKVSLPSDITAVQISLIPAKMTVFPPGNWTGFGMSQSRTPPACCPS